MIEKTVSNPTMMIRVVSGYFDNNWSGLINNNLWGNFEGYNYPHMSQTYKSVFDPCPNGYRVAPKDLWVNFVALHPSIEKYNTEPFCFNVKGGGKSVFNKGWTFFYKGMGTVTVGEDGVASEYKEPTTGLTDFYLTSGFRNRSVGSIQKVNSEMVYHSSSPGSNYTQAGDFTSCVSFVYETYSYPKAMAANVRCVKENN